MGLYDIIIQQTELAKRVKESIERNSNEDTVKYHYMNYLGYVRNLHTLSKPINEELNKEVLKIYDKWVVEGRDK